MFGTSDPRCSRFGLAFRSERETDGGNRPPRTCRDVSNRKLSSGLEFPAFSTAPVSLDLVTPVAIPLGVDVITAQSNQRAIVSLEIQVHGSNRTALFDLGFIIV